MYADVLVLNRNFKAIHIAPWQRAITLLCRGHAKVVDEDYSQYSFDEWRELSQLMTENPSGFVHSISFKMAIPDIIALTKYDRLHEREVTFTRRNIYKHYNNRCCYCGHMFRTEDLNLDHVFPKSRGGKANWENIVLSCLPCNSKKADRTPAEAGLRSFYVPSKPTWTKSFEIKVSTGIPMRMSWARIIDKEYWNAELQP